MPDHSSRHHADGRLKGQTRQRDEIQIHHIPESAITDLDQDCKPQDIVDALSDIRFKGRGPSMLRIDTHVRDYLVSAVSALSGHKRR
jgi:hypothetical protein